MAATLRKLRLKFELLKDTEVVSYVSTVNGVVTRWLFKVPALVTDNYMQAGNKELIVMRVFGNGQFVLSAYPILKRPPKRKRTAEQGSPFLSPLAVLKLPFRWGTNSGYYCVVYKDGLFDQHFPLLKDSPQIADFGFVFDV